MKVVLKVLNGASAGKEFALPGEKFMIGRGPECQLRPKSDDISSKHCVLIEQEQKLIIKDLGSTNGTFVNDEKIEQDVHLTTGDKFRVGPLEFEVTVNHELGGKKRSKISSIREAAARTAEKPKKKEDVDIDDMFADETPAASNARTFSLDEIKVVPSQAELDKKAEEEAKAEAKAKKAKTKAKKVYGKLPTQEEDKAEAANTKDAAQDMLNQIFKK